MELFFFESIDEANQAADRLQALGGRAIKFLAQCIEHGEVERISASATAVALENAGFLFVRDNKIFDSDKVTMHASLAGEEALSVLEERLIKKDAS